MKQILFRKRIGLHHHAILLGITVLTALDTANALADIIASKFTEDNTELVDINNLRSEKLKLAFTKMQSCGNDYIVFDNRDGKITCPESIAVNYVIPHYGIGGDGIVLIENSTVADAKMRIFYKDGSEGAIGGNSIRMVGKYLYEKGIVVKNDMKIETANGIYDVKVYPFSGKVPPQCIADIGNGGILPLTRGVRCAITNLRHRLTAVSLPPELLYCINAEGISILSPARR